MAFLYPFDIDETANERLNASGLEREIEASTIVVQLDPAGRVTAAGDGTFTVAFKQELSEDERESLAAIVEAHNGDPSPDDPIQVSLADVPKTRDGRQIVTAVTLEPGQWHSWHGAGDDELLGDGALFAKACLGGLETLDWSYRDPVWLMGGKLRFTGADLGDWLSATVYAPPTPITPNANGTGNANLVFGVLIPAAGDGAYDVDLAQAVPVPTQSGTGGYWTWTIPADGRGGGTVAPSAEPGTARYHLVPARVDLVKFVNRVPLLGDGFEAFEPQGISASLCLPQWHVECQVFAAGESRDLKVVWRALVARYWTTQ